MVEGVWGYAHIRTGVLDVKVSWVLSIIEMPYYILMVTEWQTLRENAGLNTSHYFKPHLIHIHFI